MWDKDVVRYGLQSFSQQRFETAVTFAHVRKVDSDLSRLESESEFKLFIYFTCDGHSRYLPTDFPLDVSVTTFKSTGVLNKCHSTLKFTLN